MANSEHQVHGAASSVDNALRLLHLVTERGEVRVTEVADLLGTARSTAYRLLAALRQRGFVDQDRPNGAYRIGPALLALGWAAVGHSTGQAQVDLRAKARPVLEDLRDATEETVSLAALEGRSVRFVDCAESRRHVRVGDRTGIVLDAHCTSVGKSLLALLPADDLERRYPNHHLPMRTSHSVTSWRTLTRELGVIRRMGYAMNDQESNDEVCAIGVALAGPPLGPLAGIGLAVPASRVEGDGLRRFVEPLLEARDRLARELNLAPTGPGRG